jgi:outer membrane protein
MVRVASAGRACGVVLALAAGLWATPVPAQTPPPPTVIVIADINQILHEAKSAKDVQAQLDKTMTAFSKDVSQQENQLQKMRDDLENQRRDLAPDAFSAKTRDYQQRFDALDRTVQGKRQALQQSYNDAMTKIENVALQIVAQVASERKANLVLTRAAVLFADNGLDITAEVLKRLDAKLPAMAVVLPKDTAPPPAKPN